MVFACTMCLKETCYISAFCEKCQLVVDIVAAEAHRDECKKHLKDAEKAVKEARDKVDKKETKDDAMKD
jgi:hypothetical protein